MRKLFFLFLTIVLISQIGACRKDQIILSDEARISFSSDTLFFDTIFTSVGSVTQSLKIINPNDQKLKLSSIKLAGGNSSPFKLNVNGIVTTGINDEIIRANDSIYLFVQVLIDPDDSAQPFILQDSIEVQYNGNKRFIQLRAYGQNAFFLKDKVISSDTTWTDSLPIVIAGSLVVDSNVTLKINPGSNIYIHATAPVIVYGTLNVSGTVVNPVTFAGDRTDDVYKDLPAGWPGIYFTPSSKNNVFKSAIIKNAYQGIIAEQMPDNANPKITLSQSVIQNIYDVGLLSVNSSIVAENSLIANCGNNIALLLGGNYSFVNCTVATFGSFYINHKTPVLQMTDYLELSDGLYTSDLNAQFVNSIFWGDNGSVDDEIFIEKKGSNNLNVNFENCIYKSKESIPHAVFTNSFHNTPPLFDSINTSKNIYDFHFNNKPESPALKAGKIVPYLFDLEGKERGTPPDIGCFEH